MIYLGVLLLAAFATAVDIQGNIPAGSKDVCRELPEGYHSFGPCSQTYWYCANNTSDMYNCDEGMYFNVNTTECEPMSEVGECTLINAMRPRYYRRGSCKKGCRYSKPKNFKGYCRYNDGSYRNNGFYTHHKYDRTVLKCRKGRVNVLACPDRYYFDHRTKYCLRKYNRYNHHDEQPQDFAITTALGVISGGLAAASFIKDKFFSPAPNRTDFCVDELRGNYTEFKCDNVYIECDGVSKDGFVRTCPSGYIYKNNITGCDLPVNVPECKEVDFKEPQDFCFGFCFAPAYNSTRACLDKPLGYNSIGECSPYFLSCVEGGSMIMECGEGMLFDGVSKKCVGMGSLSC